MVLYRRTAKHLNRETLVDCRLTQFVPAVHVYMYVCDVLSCSAFHATLCSASPCGRQLAVLEGRLDEAERKLAEYRRVIERAEQRADRAERAAREAEVQLEDSERWDGGWDTPDRSSLDRISTTNKTHTEDRRTGALPSPSTTKYNVQTPEDAVM